MLFGYHSIKGALVKFYNGYLHQTWNDTRLDWSGNVLYTDIEEIYSTESELFVPPIVVENS